MSEREDLLRRIKANILKNGYHVTLVTSKELPRFAYTIGCTEILGFELIFAGGEYYSKDDISRIIDQHVRELQKGVDWKTLLLTVNSLGYFSLTVADKSWSELLALGVFDYYNRDDIQILQILPDKDHFTLDTPDMSRKFEVDLQPVWCWLVKEWDYPVPRNSTAVTNLKVLFGEKATEVMRWEVDEWEIFCGAGPEVQKEDMRALPLAILIGIDKTLEPALFLQIDKGIWRDSVDLIWNDWG
ncbi:MAG TPA: DUF4262 domain-containing protein [Ohtaekwangia sp.]|uniref:DUF4262 domain-containing protein n=1 Tax=Ohtaekwangia sp. TaxID=2066019 RepID=UPI002F91C97F